MRVLHFLVQLAGRCASAEDASLRIPLQVPLLVLFEEEHLTRGTSKQHEDKGLSILQGSCTASAGALVNSWMIVNISSHISMDLKTILVSPQVVCDSHCDSSFFIYESSLWLKRQWLSAAVSLLISYWSVETIKCCHISKILQWYYHHHHNCISQIGDRLLLQ